MPLTRVWLEFPKSSVSPIGATKSLEFQNISSYFVISKILPKIFDVIDVDLDEGLSKIPNSIIINLDEIMDQTPNLIPKLTP